MKKQFKKLSLLLLALFALVFAKDISALGWGWGSPASNSAPQQPQQPTPEELAKQFRDQEWERGYYQYLGTKQATQDSMTAAERIAQDFTQNTTIINAAQLFIAPFYNLAIQRLTAQKPSLLIDSSPKQNFLGKLFGRTNAPESIDMALATQESEHPIIKDIKDTKQLVQSGVPGVMQKLYLIFGPPGTGKTLTAQKAAHECDMDFAVMTGASLFKFACAQALTEIDNLMKHAKKNRKGTVIVVDEAESLLLDRNTLEKSSMEYKVVNHILSYLGTKSPNIVWIFTTNHPELLDQALKDRIDSFVEMGLPDQGLREKVIALHVNKTFLSPQNKNLVLMAQAQEFWTPAVIADMAVKTEGLSNRTLQGMVSGLYVAAVQNNGISQELVDDTIEQANKKLVLMNTQAA